MIAALVIGMSLTGLSEAEDVQETNACQYVSWRELRLPCTFRTDGAASVVGLRLWWTEDGGNSWRRLPEAGALEPRELVDFTAPRDGSYGFWLQAIDAVGNGSPEPGPGDEPTMNVVVDTTEPVLEVLSPGERTAFHAGQVVELKWAVRDANLPETPLKIFYVPGGDGTPVPLDGDKTAYPAAGHFLWPLPLVEGTISFVFRAQDRAGNRCETVVGPCEIKHFATLFGPKSVVAENLSRHRLLPVFYRFSDIDQEAIGAIELFWSAQDGTQGETEWQLGTTDEDRSSPVLFNAHRDGLFALAVAVKAREGDAYLRPLADRDKPDIVTLVDTYDPQIEILSLNGVSGQETWLQGGESVAIEFVVREPHLAESSGAVEVSVDGGTTWQVLEENLPAQNEKPFVYTWTVPFIAVDDLLVRIRATDRVGRTGYGVFPGKVQVTDAGAMNRVDADKLLRRARVSLSQGTHASIREALSLLKTAVGFSPESAEARYHLAQALWVSGNRPEALMHLRKAVELHPAEAAYRLELVERLLAEAKNDPDEKVIEEARSHLERVSVEELYVRSDFALLREKHRLAEQTMAELVRGRREKLEGEK